MRLNYDCVRDVLLELEKLLSIKYNEDSESFKFSMVNINQLYDSLSDKDYTIEDVLYAVKNLNEADFISAYMNYGDGGLVECIVTDITYEGHQFLQNIRPKKIWDKSKSVFQNIGTVSVDIIKSVASTVISDTINHYLPGYLPNMQTP